MGAKDLLIDAKPQETCFHGRHIEPQIYAGLEHDGGWHLADYEARVRANEQSMPWDGAGETCSVAAKD